jgi:sugar-specific transcriptional regulator TrmB
MSKLGELGLSGYEEQVYRSLLTMGPSTAQSVSDQSGVPTGRIYDVLNGLEARDVVRTRATEPTTYVAVDPETVADRLLAERERELDTRAERYRSLADEVGDSLAATPPTESQFWTAPMGSEEALTLAGELYEAADSVVRSAMGEPYDGVDVDRYGAEIEASVESFAEGVEAQVLVTPGVLAGIPEEVLAGYADLPATTEVRVSDALTVSFDLVDDDRVCFHVPHPVDPQDRLGVIDMRDERLVAQLGDSFERVWEDATPLGTVLGDDDAASAAASGDATGASEE